MNAAIHTPENLRNEAKHCDALGRRRDAELWLEAAREVEAKTGTPARGIEDDQPRLADIIVGAMSAITIVSVILIALIESAG